MSYDNPTREDLVRYAAGHLNRTYVIPIIEDNWDVVVHKPDRVVGYRFYIQQDGGKWIMEVRAGDPSVFFKTWYRDWDEMDVLRQSIDSRDVIEP